MAISARLSRKLREFLRREAGRTTSLTLDGADGRPTLGAAGDRPEQREANGKLETLIERRFGDLIKWSFVFWCGAVGAIAMLARALR